MTLLQKLVVLKGDSVVITVRTPGVFQRGGGISELQEHRTGPRDKKQNKKSIIEERIHGNQS
jgi:hypothetical protein